MKPKIISDDAQYEKALKQMEALWDAEPGTPDGDLAGVWELLIRDYEQTHYAIEAPDPISAIKFRMEQQGLKQRDLVPYIGSASRVSEVLSGKRGLSLNMIRSLHEEFGIPAESLLGEAKQHIPQEISGIDWASFPIAEMLKRGWFVGFNGGLREARQRAEELIRSMVPNMDLAVLQPAMLRCHVRSGSTMDAYALCAWQLRSHALCESQNIAEYEPETLSQEFIRELTHLSALENGPSLAKEWLSKYGVHLVAEHHLPRTHLDGAAMWHKKRPVVALTLRHDRLDSFWFTLAHELAHLICHLKEESSEVFVDDLDNGGDGKEDEADAFATDSMIPASEWESWAGRKTPDADAVCRFATHLRIHPSIVAGRIRHESGNFKLFSKLVHDGSPRETLGMV